MADLGLLEKMGSELKCPICMSLLTSTVSLTCNHFFCKSCISKSMKSSSSCPVCKLPYRPREVRPAPHMDNMVNIYKSMEMASGVNIFVTQPAPKKGVNIFVTQPAPKKDELTDKDGHASKPNGARKCKKNKNMNRKFAHNSETTIQEVADSQTSEQLSFPTKKRVHVPLNRPFEIEQSIKASTMEKLEKNSSHFTGSKDFSSLVKEKPSFDEKGNPIFRPFFWLREENEDDRVEDLSADLSQNHDIAIDSLERIVPSFSDIKDSDDDIPTKVSPSVGLDSEHKPADFYDSEMFDWTQRPCSPELFSTPMKRKGSKKAKVISEDTKASAADVDDDDIHPQPTSDERHSMENVSSDSDYLPRHSNNQNVSTLSIRKLRKRPSRENVGFNSKSIKRTRSEVPIRNLDTGTENSDRTGAAKEQSLETENNPVDFAILKCQSKTKDYAEKVEGKGSGTVKKSGSRKKNQSEKTTIKNSVVQDVLSESFKGNHHEIEKQNKKLVASSGGEFIQDKATVVEKESNDSCNNGPTHSGKKAFTKLKQQKKSRNDQIVAAVAPNYDNTASQTDAEKIKITATQCKNSEALLKKCQSVNLQTPCAFCNSYDVSEVYGEMVHYLEGKPGTYANNEGKNLIHSHKNCTEWAPNVYFQEDTAINLQHEISRSRRITCGCCGRKGAALGCYNKSCRKSFHVPCARMIPQCRWDEDNFVMLCPLHTTMTLPNEETLPSKRSRNLPPPKKAQGQVTSSWNWPSGSSKKWVLCCSGLTDEEKNNASKLAKVAGVSMAKTWSSAVTHVIASTNENGECKRTLKFMMAILEGIWIVKTDWINACLASKRPVSEQEYEITADVRGISGGPHAGRMRVMKKEPKLFSGLKFHFTGDFKPSYRGYLNDLVHAGGGAIIQRKPMISSEKGPSNAPSSFGTTMLVIYSTELPDKCNDNQAGAILDHRKKEAQSLAKATRAKVAAHTWILDSIAACKLQSFE